MLLAALFFRYSKGPKIKTALEVTRIITNVDKLTVIKQAYAVAFLLDTKINERLTLA